MVTVLDSESSGPGSGPGWAHCVVFLGKPLYSHGASIHISTHPPTVVISLRKSHYKGGGGGGDVVLLSKIQKHLRHPNSTPNHCTKRILFLLKVLSFVFLFFPICVARHMSQIS